MPVFMVSKNHEHHNHRLLFFLRPGGSLALPGFGGTVHLQRLPPRQRPWEAPVRHPRRNLLNSF
jgi:hypothetical protein